MMIENFARAHRHLQCLATPHARLTIALLAAATTTRARGSEMAHCLLHVTAITAERVQIKEDYETAKTKPCGQIVKHRPVWSKGIGRAPMKDNKPELIEQLKMLDAVIAGVVDAGLKETVALLKIARLDLAMRAHGVTEEELAYTLGSAQKTLALNQTGRRGSRIQNRHARMANHC
jgi:hypothetical protein